MKTCPNCGGKMEASVNFCTSCGTDLRNVPLDDEKKAEAATPTQPTQQTEVVQPTASVNSSQPTQAAMPRRTQYVHQDNAQNSNTVPPKFDTSKVTSQISGAVKNFDAQGFWQWLLGSWKRPMDDEPVEPWYGSVLLVVEYIVVSIGVYLGAHNALNSWLSQQGTDLPTQVTTQANSLVTSVVWRVFFYLVIAAIGTVVATYVARIFVYGNKEPIFPLVNKMVHISNYAVILAILVFLCALMGSIDNYKMWMYGLYCLSAMVLLFDLAGITSIVNDDNAVKDKFIGVIIFTVIQLIIAAILFHFFKNSILSQVQQITGVNLSSFMR